MKQCTLQKQCLLQGSLRLSTELRSKFHMFTLTYYFVFNHANVSSFVLFPTNAANWIQFAQTPHLICFIGMFLQFNFYFYCFVLIEVKYCYLFYYNIGIRRISTNKETDTLITYKFNNYINY